MNDLILIRKNLFRRKLRAILMMVSILIAFAIFAVLASFERAFNAGQDRATPDRLVVVNKISFTQPLPISYYNRVAAIDGEFYTCRPRPFEERLPWEHIFLGVKKDYLWREWQRALELDRTLDGREAAAEPASGEERELAAAGAVESLRWG